MKNATSLLFGLEGLRVVSVQVGDLGDLGDLGARRVVAVGVADAQGCPSCGVLSAKVHSRRVHRVKDLVHGRVGLELFWDQRRYACRELLCLSTPGEMALDHDPIRDPRCDSGPANAASLRGCLARERDD